MLRLFFVLALDLFLATNFGALQEKPTNQSGGPSKQNNCQVVSQVVCCKDGKDGRNGQNGKDGRDGVNGKDGRDGRDGISGVKGDKGEPGMRGQEGKISAKGEKGTPGEKGRQGEKGQQGEKGTPGTCEAQGFNKPSCCKAECSVGFHFFEKVQDLPTRGAYGVQHFTLNGTLFLAFANYHGDINKYKTSSMIYKMDKFSGSFTLYQTLQTRGARRLEYFSIADKHFLAVVNHYDGTYLLDSVIYQWNGKLFVVFQKLATKGGSDLTFFAINNDKYLVVANHHDGSTHSTKSVIYKWSGVKFNKFQEIATEGALGCKAFVISNNTFIAFANYYNSQQKRSVMSTVFKWSGGHFVKLQFLQTYGALNVKSFDINIHTFLAFANHRSGSKYNIDSFIYKWGGTKFVIFQSIPTHGAYAWHPFVIGSQTFLAVENHYGDIQTYNTKSVVYQAFGSRFVNYQEISTHGATDMTSFKYKGHTYLAVANSYNGQKNNINSALYKWV